ncbi:MAG: S8 family serine peptidase [Xanthobacteraceae bacterium]
MLEAEPEAGPLRFALAGPTRSTSPVARAAISRAAGVAERVVTQKFSASLDLTKAALGTAGAAADRKRVETAVFRDARGTLRVVYREVVVRFSPGTAQAERKKLLDKFGLEVRNRNAFRRDQLIAFDPKRKYIAERMVDLANDLTETDGVLFAFPNFVSEFQRAAPPQPINAQWHLGVVDIRKAWETTQGKGVVVAVLDDGVDVAHPNLKSNIKRNPDPNESRDKFGRDFFVGDDAPDHFDPNPKRFRAPFNAMAGNDIHGTCCAGVAAAGGDGGVFGAAPEAKILPVKVFHADDLATESRVADAIRYASRFGDILSCSWSGPESPDIQFALQEAGAGRDGKGCPVFCATGNNFATTVAFPARSSFSIGVGASTDQEKRANYSNQGPEVSIVAPSSGGAKGIFTTDVSTSNRGFNIGEAAAGGTDGLNTNSFGGTSSATPLVAGIAALMLSARPDLTRDEVRTILQDTAVKIGPRNSYDANGHSNEFGFGRVDAAKAVQAAAAARQAIVLPKKKAKKKARPASKSKAKKASKKGKKKRAKRSRTR